MKACTKCLKDSEDDGYCRKCRRDAIETVSIILATAADRLCELDEQDTGLRRTPGVEAMLRRAAKGLDEARGCFEAVRHLIDREEVPIAPHKCPRCGDVMPRGILGVGVGVALSRRDNATYICSDCGTDEALFDFMTRSGQKHVSRKILSTWKHGP